MTWCSARSLTFTAALIYGSGLTSVYALTETDFTNTGVVVSAPSQFETNTINNDSAVVVLPKGLTITKTADTSGVGSPTKANDVIAYSIELNNIGLADLSGVQLSDSIIAATDLTLVSGDADLDGILDGDEVWLYTGQFIITQQDIDTNAGGDGTIENTATVTTNELPALSDSVSVTIEATPEISITAVADPPQVSTPGLVTYTVSITNSGNVSLTGIDPQGLLPGGGVASFSSPGGDAGVPGTLDVGETWTYTVSYFVTQAGIDSGGPLSTTLSVGSNETGTDVKSVTTDVAVEQLPELLVSKLVDVAAIDTPGPLLYTITVTNSGNVSLANIALVDLLPDGSTATLTGPLSDSGIASVVDVGEIWTYTAAYNVSQTEIDTGNVLTNQVSVTSDQTGIAGVSASATTTVNRAPAFTVSKTADKAAVATVGPITYSIRIDNTGNTSLTDIVVDDVLPDASTGILVGPVTDTQSPDVLDVGESWEYTGEYTVTQTDIDNGVDLVNQVSISVNEAATQSANAVTAVTRTPAIELEKFSVENEYFAAGDVINYTLSVFNAGNVVLQNVVVSDPVADAGTLFCGRTMPFVLLPDERVDCSASRVIIDADVINTELVNQASVASTDPDGTVVAATSEQVFVAMTRVPPVATETGFVSEFSAVAVVLAGASDDTDRNGDLDISTAAFEDVNAIDSDGDGDADRLEIAGEGIWQIDNNTGEITFTPATLFTGDPTPVAYRVSDRTGLRSEPAILSVDYPQSAPAAADDSVINPLPASPLNPTVINVLADNGAGVDFDAENDIDIATLLLVSDQATDTDGDGRADTVVVDGQGVWNITGNTGVVTFTPAAGFLLDPDPIGYTVSDRTGLVSNVATIAVDYPQTAPVAVDDQLLDQPLGRPVVLNVLANDVDGEDNLERTSLRFIAPDGTRVTELVVPNEGIWSVDVATGNVVFTPVAGFITDPTPVRYTVSDSTDLESNIATITVTYEEPVTLSGVVWIDADGDGSPGTAESRKAGWTLRVYSEDGLLLGTVVTDVDGSYSLGGLPSGILTIRYHNEADVYIGSSTTPEAVVAGAVFDFSLPIDPGGVVYDSVSRFAIAGVTLNMINSRDELLHADCLDRNQQSQVTGSDGVYAFHIRPGAHASCSIDGVYRIDVASVPDAYHPNFSSLIRQQGAAQCGDATLGCAVSGTFDGASNEADCTFDSRPLTNSCEVQPQPDAPAAAENTDYFIEFELQAGDADVLFNHLPFDARANDAQLLLTKQTSKRSASHGDIVRYSINIENTKDVPAIDIQVLDVPPAGFVFAENSARLLRTGVDEKFDTDDDVTIALASSGTSAITFNEFSIAAEETVIIDYLMRVGTGVINGTYANKASASGPAGVAGNAVSATIEIVADPVLGQATLIGKVFNDRNEDGSQDSANATGVALTSAVYGDNGLLLGTLDARNSVNENPTDKALVINMPLLRQRQFRLSTAEGTRITVDQEGVITEAHIGDKARGLNAQDIRVCTVLDNAIPTLADGSVTVDGTAVDVLRIVVSNHGINEIGLPGVRLATVTGLVIETDAYGRFSIPDVSIGATGNGQNLVLKVDKATLPTGSRFTTENPYVLRIVNSTLNKINFGVLIPESDPYRAGSSTLCDSPVGNAANAIVEVGLGAEFFKRGESQVRDNQRGIVIDIVNKLREYGGGRITIETADESGVAIDLAQKRADAIRVLLDRQLGVEFSRSVSVDVNRQPAQERR